MARHVFEAFQIIQKNVASWLRKENRRLQASSPPGFKALTELVDDVNFWGLQKQEMQAALNEDVGNAIQAGIEEAERLGLAVDFDLLNIDVSRLTEEFTNEWWSQVSERTRHQLRGAIAAHVEGGVRFGQLIKNLEPVFGKARASMIAVTETTRLYAEGNRIAYANAGILETEWRTVSDAVVDPICEGLANRRQPLGNEEQVPPAHVRCRCWIAPVVDDAPLTQEAPKPGDDPPTWESTGTAESKIGTTGVEGGIHAGETKIGAVRRGTLPKNTNFSDTRVLHKRVANEANREVASFRTFELIEPGWAPTVYKDADGLGHMMRWVDESGFGGAAKAPGKYTRLLLQKERADYGRMSITDALIGNTDRHGMNAILFDGRLIPIDNGFAAGSANADIFGQAITRMGKEGLDDFLNAAQNALDFWRQSENTAALQDIWLGVEGQNLSGVGRSFGRLNERLFDDLQRLIDNGRQSLTRREPSSALQAALQRR